MMSEAISDDFSCEGCPTNAFKEYLRNNRDLSLGENGTVRFMKALDVAGRSIAAGATTIEEIIASETHSKWLTPTEDTYGDLTHKDVITAAIECRLRQTRGECPLEIRLNAPAA